MEEDVAGTDFSGLVFHDGVDSNVIVLHQFVSVRQDVELLDRRCRLTDASVKKYIEFQSFTFTGLDESCNINGLYECYHRIGRFHPEFKSVCTGGFLRIDFFHTCLFFAAKVEEAFFRI